GISRNERSTCVALVRRQPVLASSLICAPRYGRSKRLLPRRSPRAGILSQLRAQSLPSCLRVGLPLLVAQRLWWRVLLLPRPAALAPFAGNWRPHFVPRLPLLLQKARLLSGEPNEAISCLFRSPPLRQARPSALIERSIRVPGR